MRGGRKKERERPNGNANGNGNGKAYPSAPAPLREGFIGVRQGRWGERDKGR